MIRLGRLGIYEDGDVFSLRHWAREAASRLGFENADQVRIATALSEVGREVLAAGGGEATVELDAGGAALVVTLRSRRPLVGEVAAVGPSTGLAAAARLLDEVAVTPDGGGSCIVLRKALHAAARVTRAQANAIREALSLGPAVGPMDSLREQNSELLGTLGELQRQREDLLQLNEEIRETNRGVMAMYAQLSGELEETNRGVVALYAELDEKSVQLRQASEAKSRFLASVSHELRTPVNSILALSGLLAEPDGDPLGPEQLRQLELIRAAARELQALIGDLLDLAKAESGRLDAHVEPVELGPLLTEMRGMFRPLAADAVRLEVADGSGLPVLYSDRNLLAHVLRNLLSNAVKFTESGAVTLSARLAESGQHIELTVNDTGIGIAPEDRERVFEEFYQARTPIHTRHRGTGLGLPYVRRVVELLGGTLELASELGVGTTVRVVLPRQWLSLDRPPPTADPSAVRPLATVLIADDDPTFRQVLRALLQGNAERVVEAADGAEAVELATALRPDVAFIDLMMPVLDGAGVIAGLAADPRAAGVPVVIVTSAELDDDATRRLAGARAVVAKSALDAEKLRGLLASLLAGSAA